MDRAAYHGGMRDYHRDKMEYYKMRAATHWNPFQQLSAQLKVMKHSTALRRQHDLHQRQMLKAQKRLIEQKKMTAKRLKEDMRPDPTGYKRSPIWTPR